MITLAATVMGKTVKNIHLVFVNLLGVFIGGLLNSAFASLPAPLEFQEKYLIFGLDIKIGADSAVSPSPGSKEATPVPAGTIVSAPVHPDAIAADTTADTASDPTADPVSEGDQNPMV